MPYDPTNPTVTGLEAARRTAAFFRTQPAPGPGPEGLLMEALSSALRPGAAIVRRPIIDTVSGQSQVLFAVVASGRRIAVVGATSQASRREAAMVLVYGTFDAVYAVHENDLAAGSPRIASAIASMESRLFTPAGRRALAVCALSPGTGSAAQRAKTDRGPVALRDQRRDEVRALRLNRPAEWSEDFEAALDAVGSRLAMTG